jgi:hypothetical protein
MQDRFEAIWSGRDQGPTPIDPNQQAADSLGVWFEERFGKLQPPTRERIYALMVLLQRRYFYLRRRSPQEQYQLLHDAYETVYDRLEEVLEDTDMPLPQWQEPTSQTTTSAEAVPETIELYQDAH